MQALNSARIGAVKNEKDYGEGAALIYRRLSNHRVQRRRPMSRRESYTIAAALVLPAALAMTAAILPAFAQTLPNGNGKELVEMVCTACHELSQ